MAIPVAVLAALASAGVSAGGNLANTGLNFVMNKHLQEDAQDFNSAEAAINREFNSQEAQKSRDFTAQESLLNRQFNSQEAQKSRDFQQYMAETNYQRTISDMEKAGINPAAIGAGLSSTGSGSAGASASASSAGGFAASGSNAYSGVNHANSGFGADLVDNAFIKALANDKSFLQDFTRNLKHSAREEEIEQSSDFKHNSWDYLAPYTQDILNDYWKKRDEARRKHRNYEPNESEKRALKQYRELLATYGSEKPSEF